jgi:hypothetical protein
MNQWRNRASSRDQLGHQLAFTKNDDEPKYFTLREVYAAARAMERKDRAGEHWAFIAEKYQDMAKEDKTLAAVHKTMAGQLT